MNDKITLSRETLENSLKDGSSDPVVYASYRKAVADIRAALAEPTIGIDHETMRARYTDPEAVGLSSGTGSTLRVVAADPVPPAGGEPETVATMYVAIPGDFKSFVCLGRPGDGGKFYKEEPLVTLEDHRAHVTRLQAEVERLRERVTPTHKALIGKHAELIRQRDALQTELTKAREALREIICACGDERSHGYISMLAEDALSNQSAPADKGQGEPVAWLTTGSRLWADKVVEVEQQADKIVADRNDGTRKVALYTEQPAPVAVVMPDRRISPPLGPDFYARGWNACLDEVARLNSEQKP